MIRLFADITKAMIAYDAKVKKAIPIAHRRALGRVPPAMSVKARAAVVAAYHIKSGTVSKTLKPIKSGMDAGLRSVGPSLPLSSFKVTGGTRKKPLFVAVKKGGGGTIDKAFRATVAAGKTSHHNGVFRRVGKDRLPIKHLYGTAVPHALSNDDIADEVQTAGAETYSKRFAHEMGRAMQ